MMYNVEEDTFACTACPDSCSKCDYEIPEGGSRKDMDEFYLSCSECEKNYKLEEFIFNDLKLQLCAPEKDPTCEDN
jgi:hypothetical protein